MSVRTRKSSHCTEVTIRQVEVQLYMTRMIIFNQMGFVGDTIYYSPAHQKLQQKIFVIAVQTHLSSVLRNLSKYGNLMLRVWDLN